MSDQSSSRSTSLSRRKPRRRKASMQRYDDNDVINNEDEDDEEVSLGHNMVTHANATYDHGKFRHLAQVSIFLPK